MTFTRRSKTLAGCALCLCGGFAAAACQSPAAPTKSRGDAGPPASIVPAAPTVSVPPGPSVAAVAIEDFGLTWDYAGALAPTLRLVETSGRSGAQVLSLGFNLADGAPSIKNVSWPR